MTSATLPHFTWLQVLRLGLVQACLGAVVVMTTSTLNRVMVVELALPAMVPGLLVALHYALQLARPRMGHGSDLGQRRTPWILGGQITLALGGVVAAIATAWMGTQQAPGLALAVLGFVLIGLGVSACGTSLLVLLAKRVAPQRRAAAATVVWVMMIVGFAVTAGVAGKLLDPYSPARLVSVMAGVSMLAVVVTVLALWRLEGDDRTAASLATLPPAAPEKAKLNFREALRITWADDAARRFTVFVFVSMFAYSAQDLILEPFAGVVFGFTPGQSTSLSGTQHGGVLLGMLMAGLAGNHVAGRRFGSLKAWTVGGCIASALAMAALVVAGLIAPLLPLSPIVFVLGVANGAFSIAAIGSMMKLASEGGEGREGVRMGLWGAAQGIAFGAGGFLGTVASDVAHALVGSPALAYGSVFALEAVLFVVAAWIALSVGVTAPSALAAGRRQSPIGAMNLHSSELGMDEFDVVVVGGGPAGATAAQDLARLGRRVLLLDRAGRIKPCGGAIPPRAMLDFEIPESMLVARARCARMVAPTGRHVDIPIEGGYVGLVDREHFDEWLRERARASGAERRAGRFEALERDADGQAIVVYRSAIDDLPSGQIAPLVRVRARTVIGADGARSEVARQAQIPGAERTPFVFAYHEILQSPEPGTPGWDGSRCDVIYRGSVSPDFYGWVFPHGKTVSVGTGSADKGYSLRNATQRLRSDAGLEHLITLRREGAPIPLKPLPKWDNGRDVVLAGDAAGVVAPASGEGIYYAMTGGRYAADAVDQLLSTGSVKSLTTARRRFMREHGRVFWVLGILQRFWYRSDKRRERFVAICEDKDVQQLTFDAYMNKRLVRAKPMAHVRIFFKDMAHLLGLARV